MLASAAGAAVFLRARDASRENARLAEAATVAGDLRNSLLTQAASVRAYFLNADKGSYDEYTAARAAAADLTGRLQGLVSGRRLSDQIEQVARDALTWRTEAINPLIALEQAGAYQQVLEQYGRGGAVTLFRKTAVGMRALQRDMTRASGAASNRADATRLNAIEFGVGYFALFALALATVRAAASSWLVEPISALAQTMRSSDPLDELPRPSGPRELRDLADSSHGLRGRLQEELSAASRTRATLGQHSSALLSLRVRADIPADHLPNDWDHSALLVPALGVIAGDCYDIDCVDDIVTIIVVDVIEQGSDAAIIGLRTKEMLRAGIRLHGDLGQAVRWASEQMPEAIAPGVTAFVARVECATGALSYVNAGHPEPLLCDGVRCERLTEVGPEFGTRGGGWSTSALTMHPGQVLVAYTDGLLAGRTESHARFGPSRLGQVVRDNYGDSCEVIVKQVLHEAGAFVPGRAHDDIVVSVLARAMPM